MKIAVRTEGHAKLEDALVRVLKGGASPRPLMKAIEQALIASTTDRFDREVDPDEEPWEPLQPATKKRKGHDRILQDTEDLAGSIDSQRDDNSVEVGTNKEYMVYHQDTEETEDMERESIPERAVFGISDEDREDIEDLADRFMKKLLKV